MCGAVIAHERCDSSCVSPGKELEWESALIHYSNAAHLQRGDLCSREIGGACAKRLARDGENEDTNTRGLDCAHMYNDVDILVEQR